MRAATFSGPGRMEIVERVAPSVSQIDDVLIEVTAVGVCGSDLQVLSDAPEVSSMPGVILGHEITGRVADTAPSAGMLMKIGQTVVVRPIVFCGTCRQCLLGFPATCQNKISIGFFSDGGFASHVVAPARACIPIAEKVPSHIAAVAEPLACVIGGARLARPFPGEDAVVIGAGPIGLLYIGLLRAAGLGTIVAVEPSAARAAAARQMGADRVIGIDDHDALPRLMPDGPAIVVDAVGSQLGVAVEIAAPHARVVAFGVNHTARPAVPQQLITSKELQVAGSVLGYNEFPAAVRLLEMKTIDVSPVITDIVELDGLVAAIERMRRGEAIKTIVRPH